MNNIPNITQEILAIARGDGAAINNVVEGLYEELCRIAESQLGRANPQRMVASDLVHELYLKLTACERINASGRQHFLSIAATAMRQLIIDQIKAQGRFKRGGNLVATTLSDEKMPIAGNSTEILAVNRALSKLHDEVPVLASTVECRYFAGYSELETAEALATSVRTVRRYWSRARKWLALELASEQ